MPTVAQRYDPAFPIDELVEHPDNPRRGDEAAIEASMEHHGFYGSVLVQASTNRLIAGNHRTRVARRRGETTVPALLLDVDDDQARRILLVDNRTNDTAGYDDAELARLLADLAAHDGALVGTGFTDADLAKLLADLETPAPAEVDAPAEPAPALTAPGDIWQLGAHRIICGSCHDPDVVARLLGGARVNVAFTSPPYAEQREYDEASGFVPIKPAQFVDWFEPVQANVAGHLADDGSWFVNIKPPAAGLDTDLYVFDLVIAHVRRWGWHFATEFCWERNGVPKSVTRRFKNQFEPVYQFARGAWKMRADSVRHHSDNVPVAGGPGVGDTSWAGAQGGNGAMFGNAKHSKRAGDTQGDSSYALAQAIAPGMAYPGNRLPTFAGTHDAVGHAAAFPVGLPAWFARAYSDPGDTLFDPFTGSGSSLLAAQQTGRIGFGCELSPAYVDMTCLRFERATGLVPVRNGESVSFVAARAT